MKTLKAAVALVFILTFNANAMGQVPGIQGLTQTIDQAASQLTEDRASPLGFKKLQMPKSLGGLLDIRFKKPQLPSLGLLDKLKNIGKPQVDSGQATTGPILAGLSKLFPPKQDAGGSFLEKMFGTPAQTNQSLFNQGDMSDLTEATKGLSDHVGRMSNGVRSSATQLFNGQAIGSGTSGSIQPPLQTARQYPAGQIQSRY